MPFFSLTGVYEGPAAKALGGTDISWVAGLLVSGVLYYALSRSLDLTAERSAIAARASFMREA